jgi:hypothetical protein
MGPLVVLLAVLAVVSAGRGRADPSSRDDEVFLQASYLVRTQHVSPIEGVTRAAGIQYGWGGKLAQRLRSEGDIQTYALIPVWSRIGGFRTGPSPWGRSLYVQSRRISALSQAGFAASALLLLWALLPLGRGVALAAAVLLAVAHPFRHGPALFDPWVMPLAVGALGAWLRDRHRTAAALAVAATLVKPNYVFLLPAFLLASLVAPGPGDVPRGRGRRPAAVYLAAGAGVAVAYALLAAGHVIAAGQYAQGARSGYDPGVLAYSFLETVGFRYRAGTLQLRHHWPVFPWTAVNVAALALAGHRAWRHGRLRRTAALLAGLILVPILADFAVMGSVGAYEDGGHFRWINVSILGTAVALPLAYREVAGLVRRALAPAPVQRYAERVAVPAP